MSKKENVQKFFNEYKELCKKYNLSLAHEDYHGAFIIQEYNEENIEWVEAALIQSELDEYEQKREKEEQERFDTWYGELKSLLDSGMNIVETEKGHLKENFDEPKGSWNRFDWVPSIYKVFDESGNELREATNSEIGKTEFVVRCIRGHKSFYDDHEDGMNIDLKEFVNWYEKYK